MFGFRNFRIGMGAIALLALAAPAHATFVFTVYQAGNDLVVNGSGFVNLSGLSYCCSTSIVAQGFSPSSSAIGVGSGTVDGYGGVSGPSNFGSGSGAFASSSSGDVVKLTGFNGRVYVPGGYVSGSVLSGTATYLNQSFASMGLTPGTYTYSWGSDSIIVQIVPEPSSLANLSVAGFLAAVAILIRRMKSQGACT